MRSANTTVKLTTLDLYLDIATKDKILEFCWFGYETEHVIVWNVSRNSGIFLARVLLGPKLRDLKFDVPLLQFYFSLFIVHTFDNKRHRDIKTSLNHERIYCD